MFFSTLLGVDIYVLRDVDLEYPTATSSPLYSGTSLHSAIQGPVVLRPENDQYIGIKEERPAIIIISYADGHYELVARKDTFTDRVVISTKFRQEEPIITELYVMLLGLRARA